MLDAYVYEAVRTPRGLARPGGALVGVKPVNLVADLMRRLVARVGLAPTALDDVLLGCVTQTGEQGANLAKTASLVGGLGHSVSAATLNRYCCSGLDAVNLAAAKVASGVESLVLAGGVEMMSRVPMMSDRGAWYADPDVAAQTGFVHMGVAADLVATLDGTSREDCDAWAFESHARAARAQREGRFARAMEPVCDDQGATLLAHDEAVRPTLTREKLASLSPAFAGVGAAGADAVALRRYPTLSAVTHLHTVATSPGVVDGAALVLVGNRAAGRTHGLKPLARIVSFANASTEPVLMLTAPADATRRALDRASLTLDAVSLFEMNESFAAVVLRYLRALKLDPARVNVDGGALAMGHPLGATGAMLVSTLVDALARTDGRYGVVSLCGGAGVASATVFERAPL